MEEREVRREGDRPRDREGRDEVDIMKEEGVGE